MKDAQKTEIDGCFVYDGDRFLDDRGYFREMGEDYPMEIKKVNMSVSRPYVVRGMHGQTEHPQAKLVQCLNGTIIDFVVDIRKDSPTYGKKIEVELSAMNCKSIFVPKGCLHGFCVVGDAPAIVVYMCDEVRYPSDEVTYNINSEAFGIKLPYKFKEAKMSKKDKEAEEFFYEK